MNLLVKKEIRLIAPAWGVVMVVLLAFPWLGKGDEWIHVLTPAALFFGMIILSVDSFGREFSMGTFLPLLSQPVERRRIWRTKMTVLGAGIGIILVAFIISCTLRFHMAQMGDHFEWHWKSNLSWAEWWECQASYIALVLVACSGALWTTLLIRQVAAAFWVTFLMPVIIVAALSFIVPAKLTTWPWLAWLSYSLPFVYGLAGFWLAHRLFHRAQDVVWGGGVIDFSRWRYLERDRSGQISTRRRRPVAALLQKECQFHSITLFCAGALLVLHGLVILIRTVHGKFEPNSLMAAGSEYFCTFWGIMPLVIGGMAIGEEHRLGVLPEQFCLPVSRRLQFVLKILPVLFAGTVLGGLLPVAIEGLAPLLGAASLDFKPVNYAEDGPYILRFALVASGAAFGLTLLALFASSLARNFMQALGFAVVTIIGCGLYEWLVSGLAVGPLALIFSIPAALLVFVWLTYANFKRGQERERLWRRNFSGLAAAISLVLVSAAVVYHRGWEVFEPAEPAHGAPRLSLAHPPGMRLDRFDNLQLRLPDGRVWSGHLRGRELNSARPLDLLRYAWDPLPYPISAGRIQAGSNWACLLVRHIHEWSQTAENGKQKENLIEGNLETVGIKTDGTLWVSAKPVAPNPPAGDLTRFGNDTNWQAVGWSYPVASVLLLKQDGTLWRWGFPGVSWTNGLDRIPPLPTASPYQIGTNSDWRDLSFSRALAQKKDGSVWHIRVRPGGLPDQIVQETNWDGTDLNVFSQNDGYDYRSFVRRDGTLWLYAPGNQNSHRKAALFQSGKATDWVASAMIWRTIIALKSDGTLWQWGYQDVIAGREIVLSPVTPAPVRLGIHQDWVDIMGFDDGVVALAADGSCWYWPDRDGYGYASMPIKLPKQPKYLGNVFDGR